MTNDRSGLDAAGVAPEDRRTFDVVDALLLDLLEWIGSTPRPYADVIEAWRTSCPRLPVWEEASRRGLVVRQREPAGGTVVSVSRAGVLFLRERRPASSSTGARA